MGSFTQFLIDNLSAFTNNTGFANVELTHIIMFFLEYYLYT